MIPAFDMTTFWLQNNGRDEVVIADMPPGLANLKIFYRYSRKEFLDALEKLEPLGMPVHR